MLSASIQQKIDKYEQINSQLKKELKWKFADNRSIMMVSSMYVINGKEFNYKRYKEICDYIKDNVGTFSTLNSYQRFTTAAMLELRFEQPKEAFHDLLKIYDQLVANKFSRGTFTYIAALVLLTNSGANHLEDKIRRVHSIYKGMQKRHLFLTTSGDYPLAVLLAELEGSVEELMEHVETFYNKLHEQGFRKGNDLQFMSHILSLEQETEPYLLVERSREIFDTFKLQGKKPKRMHYPEVGLLALLKDGKNHLDQVFEIMKELNARKSFKWNKDMNFIMAVNFVMSEKIEDSSLLETGLYTTMEAIMQAQQAAMIAAMAGVSAASTSS